MTLRPRSRRGLLAAGLLCAALGAATLHSATASYAGPPGQPHLPDLQTVIPLDSFSIVSGPDGREFRYTHWIYNGGDGPLAIAPFYQDSAGTYLGRQQVTTHDDADTWSVASTRRVADAFEFHAEHGHFHFPLASFGLYAVAPGGGFGDPVTRSPKNGFCIADSAISDDPLEHSGAGAGWWGTCTDPTTRRGISVGGFDEYDFRDPGQSVPLDGVPDGTYWFRAVSDPNDDFEETDESNNEEAVKVTIDRGTVTAGEVRHPDTTPCTVSLLSPAEDDRLAGQVQLTAETSAGAGAVVSYLLDGRVVGRSGDEASSFASAWRTGSTVDGVHWLTARTTQAGGRVCSSPVAEVVIAGQSGPDTSGPLVRITDPENGGRVGGRIALGATAADASGVAAVRFLVDGRQVGPTRHDPPYSVVWNSRPAKVGKHRIQVLAVDRRGNASRRSIHVRVRHVPAPERIRVDASAVARGTGQLTTPRLSTSVPRTVLLALVSYDGLYNTDQSATVSGGGLSWHLVKRSNSQPGDSEIWAATARHRLDALRVRARPDVPGFSGMLSVLALRGASGVGVAAAAGSPTSAPEFYVPGVQEGSWVFAAGNDWDGAVTRTPAAGQTLVRQWVNGAEDNTFWVQSTTRPTTSTRLVTIKDTAPTDHRWNYVGVEVVARRRPAVGGG